MAKGPFNNQVWDESTWEAHINELEDKTRRLKHFITPHGEESNPRWLFLLQDYDSELEVVDTYVMEELIFEEAYFPDEEDDDWDEEDEIDEFWDEIEKRDEDEYFLSDEFGDFDEIDEGEDWKRLSDDFMFSDPQSIEYLELYIEARKIGARILTHARAVEPHRYTINFIRLVDAVLKVATKIVAGYALGFEKDLLGGNIVYNKKALRWANYALTLLHNLKQHSLFTKEEYYELHEALFELRNELGIYVQDLRDQFEAM